MWESPEALEVSEEARRTLEGWVSARTSPQRIAMRARIVLLAAQGMANRRIAQEVRTSRPTVLLWRNRFAAGGVGALLQDAPGRGRPASISAAKVRRIVAGDDPRAAAGGDPLEHTDHGEGAGRQSRHGAAHLGCPRTAAPPGEDVQALHIPAFVEKVADMVGCTSIHQTRRWSCVSTRSRRFRRSTGRNRDCRCAGAGGATRTHDYARHGTTSLFAALYA